MSWEEKYFNNYDGYFEPNDIDKRKIHCLVDNGYGQDKGIVCNGNVDDPIATSIDQKITCKNCLKRLTK